MSKDTSMRLAAAAAAPTAPQQPIDRVAIDQALKVLTSYDEGSNRGTLVPFDEAVRATLGDAAARKELAGRLAVMLSGPLPRAAKEYICSKLGLIGSAESVPALAALLPDPALCHAACSALEAIPGPESVDALRRQLAKLSGLQKAAVITSLGTRRDTRSVAKLSDLMTDSNDVVARPAIAALGQVGNPAAARALARFRTKAPAPLRLPMSDACLACAEQLLADGRGSEARAVYESLRDASQPKHVRLAAERGLQKATQLKRGSAAVPVLRHS